MTTFTIGQRVRIARLSQEADCREFYRVRPQFNPRAALGMAATVIGVPSSRPGYDCNLAIDDPFNELPPSRGYAAMFYQLEPLTDPKADQFIESLRKLKPYEEPKVVPVRQGTPIWK